MADFLSREDFAHMVRVAILVAIDLVIRDTDGNVLVGRRTNAPARNWYFVPGGIVRKNERLDDGFTRILTAETGLTSPRAQARLLGVYEHIYPDNRFDEPGYNTHYVVLGYELRVGARPEIHLDDQHSDIRWMTVAELLASPEVHENTKAYLR